MNVVAVQYNIINSILSIALYIFCTWGLLFSGWPSRYLEYLIDFPGAMVIWILLLFYGIETTMFLPQLFLAIARAPAFEYDGETIVVRSWKTSRFNLGTESIRISHSRQGKRVRIDSSSGRSATIYIDNLNGPKEVRDVLQRWTTL